MSIPQAPALPSKAAQQPKSKTILHLIRDFRTFVTRERSATAVTKPTLTKADIDIKDQVRLNIRLKIQNSAAIHIDAIQQLGNDLRLLEFADEPGTFFRELEQFYDKVERFFSQIPEELTELVRMRETGDTESLWPIDRWSIVTALALFNRRRRSLLQEIDALSSLTAKTPAIAWKELDDRTWYDGRTSSLSLIRDGGGGALSLITRVKAFITEATNMTIDVEQFLPLLPPLHEEVLLFSTADLVDQGIWLTKSGVRLSNTRLRVAVALLGLEEEDQQYIEKYVVQKAEELLTKLYANYLEKAISLMKQEWEVYTSLVAADKPRQTEQLVQVANEMIQFAAKRVLSDKVLEEKFEAAPAAKEIGALMELMIAEFKLRKGELNLKAIQVSSSYVPIDVSFCDECKQPIADAAIICGICAVAFYCSTECAMASESEHLRQCRGLGPEVVDNLFKYPDFETIGSINQSGTLENGQKYLELEINSEGQTGDNNPGEQCVALFTIPATTLEHDLPVINFMAIDINPRQLHAAVGANAVHPYTIYRRANSQVWTARTLRTIQASLDGPVRITPLEPDENILLYPGESIFLKMSDGIEKYTITVQIGLSQPGGHLW